MTLLGALGWIVGAVFALSALLITIRMVRGRSLLDRMIASDVLLTTLILVIGAEMVVNGHTANIPFMIALAAVATFAAIAVALTVSKQDRAASPPLSESESGEEPR